MLRIGVAADRLRRAGGYIIRPPPPSPGYPFGTSPYEYAGNSRTELILGLGADPNERLTWGGVDWTPLTIAVHQDYLEAVKALIDHGADPNARWCVAFDTDASRRIRMAGCNLTNGVTPLMYATAFGYLPLQKLLIELGANPVLRDWDGRTAADYGAKRPGG